MRRSVIISKMAVLIAVLLWVFTAFNFFFYRSSVNEENIVLAFTNASLLDTSAKVSCMGAYGKSYTPQQEREKLLKMIAEELGLGTYEIITQRQENITKTSLIYTGNRTSAILAFICVEEGDSSSEKGEIKQYISMEINLSSQVSGALSYKKKMTEVLENIGVEATVRMYLQGSIRGNLKLETRNEVADALLEDMHAKVVSDNRDMDCYNIYAYTKDAGDALWVDGERVNVNLSMNYNELNDRTYIYLALPMNNQDF